MLGMTRSRYWQALAAAVALLVVVLPASGARTPGLFEAEVGFEGDRDKAFREALGLVLVRLTGRRDAARSAELEPLLAGAAAYAQQFSQPAPDRLWVGFDGAALERELGRLGQPVWGAERPSTLLWVAVDAGGGKRFVVSSGADFEEEAALRGQILEAAQTRGLPMVFPLMDAEDRGKASFGEVWGGFEDSIRAASERYGVDAVLVGRLAAEDRGYGRWSLYSADGVEQWSGSIPESVDRLADGFAARFAVVSSGDTRAVLVAVSGVTSIEDFGRVSRFLGGLTAVETFGIETVEGDQVMFRVALRGEPAALDQAVRLGGVLRPDGAAGPRQLNYRVAR